MKDELLRYTQNEWDGTGYCNMTGSTDRGGNECWRVGNLVTKQRYFHKPTYQSLAEALRDFRGCLRVLTGGMMLTGVKIAMPKIGCGLDGLDWAVVENIICETFGCTDAEITVYVKEN